MFDFSMRLGFYRAIFFLRVARPWIDMRYIPPDLGNVLEAYKKYFDVWKNFEVDLKLNGRPQYTQPLTTNLWKSWFQSRFSTFQLQVDLKTFPEVEIFF